MKNMSIRRREMGEEKWSEHKANLIKEKAKRWQNIHNRNNRRKKKTALVKYLGGKCFRCGLETEYIEVYDFHHIDPSKKDYEGTSK